MRRCFVYSAIAAGAAAMIVLPPGGHVGRAADPKSADKPAGFAEASAILAKHCYGCHGSGKKSAGLSLESYKDEQAVMKDRKVWEQVLRMIRSGEMPPSEKPKPAPAELAALDGFVTAALSKFDCTGRRDPGRVTIRRLNRAEYRNTIRDLVGIDFDPAATFPADEVGYGFDNIGDVLTIAPILAEKYLAAAEKIAGEAVVTNEPPKPVKSRIEAKDLKAVGEPVDNRRVLNAPGEITAPFTFSADGDFLFRVQAAGKHPGLDPVRMSLKIDGREVKAVDVPTAAAYEIRIPVKAGAHKLSAAMLPAKAAPAVVAKAPAPKAAPNPKNKAAKKEDPPKKDEPEKRELAVDYFEIEGPVSLAPKPPPATHRRIMGNQNGKPKGDWARDIMSRFATRAFRRPATPEEVERLGKIVDLAVAQGDPFEKGVQLAIQAVLVSPHFLFRVEGDRTAASGDGRPVPIGEYELASRLSYFLWSSMPDDTLIQLAEKGRLRASLDEQVRRMLKDPKARALVDNFAGQWLQLRNLKNFAPDAKMFPGFNAALKEAMETETEMFFEAVMREDRSILDFIDADFSYLNEPLAAHYGIPGVKGPNFRKVTFTGAAAAQRGGVLTHGSVLAITSNPTRTSPVKRGKWVLENLLGTPPPPPPPGAGDLNDDAKVVLSGSLRKRMEQHRANPTCASCHSRMDPIGFGFENFDAVGQWREKDGNFAIDPAGVLPDGKSFKGPADLKQILKGKKDLFARCLAEKMLTYALGRGLEYYDKCAVDAICAGLAKGDYKFSALVLETAKAEPFLMRRGTGAGK